MAARAVVLKRLGATGRKTGGRRNGLDDGERERESHLGQHDILLGVEAGSGLCKSDRGAQHLFLRLQSNEARSAHVFVCTAMRVAHIRVSRLTLITISSMQGISLLGAKSSTCVPRAIEAVAQ